MYLSKCTLLPSTPACKLNSRRSRKTYQSPVFDGDIKEIMYQMKLGHALLDDHQM